MTVSSKNLRVFTEATTTATPLPDPYRHANTAPSVTATRIVAQPTRTRKDEEEPFPWETVLANYRAWLHARRERLAQPNGDGTLTRDGRLITAKMAQELGVRYVPWEEDY